MDKSGGHQEFTDEFKMSDGDKAPREFWLIQNPIFKGNWIVNCDSYDRAPTKYEHQHMHVIEFSSFDKMRAERDEARSDLGSWSRAQITFDEMSQDDKPARDFDSTKANKVFNRDYRTEYINKKWPSESKIFMDGAKWQFEQMRAELYELKAIIEDMNRNCISLGLHESRMKAVEAERDEIFKNKCGWQDKATEFYNQLATCKEALDKISNVNFCDAEMDSSKRLEIAEEAITTLDSLHRGEK